MRCSNCGAEFASHKVFCTQCGQRVPQNAQPTADTPQAVAAGAPQLPPLPAGASRQSRIPWIVAGGLGAVLLVVVALVLAGPDGGSPASAPGPSSIATAAPAGLQSEEPIATLDPVPTKDEPAPEDDGPYIEFITPSGNIGCYMESTFARCDILERSWEPPSAPTDCDLDWGHGLYVEGGGRSGFACAGDTVRNPTSAELAYGEVEEVGTMICASTESGVTCTERRSGHGFPISRGSYRIF